MRYDISHIPELLAKIKRDHAPQGKRKMTDETMADDIGRSRAMIRSWRYGDAYPSMLDIAVMCEVYELDVSEFFREMK